MKPIEDRGAVAAASKPLRLRRFTSQHLPDPGEAVDCLIAVCDPGTAEPSVLAFSDGSRWHLYRRQEAPAQQTIDVTPLVQQAVREMLPALIPAAPAPMLPAPAPEPAPPEPELRQIAAAVLETAEMVNSLAHRLHEAEQRIEYLERVALAKVEVKGAA